MTETWQIFGFSFNPHAFEIIATLAGPAAIALVLHVAASRERRWTATHELLKELNSDRLADARSAARELIQNNVAARKDDLEAHTECEKSLREKAFLLMRHHAQLSVLATSDKLDDKLSFSLFAEVFAYWWGMHYELRKPTGFRLRGDLNRLNSYFERLARRYHSEREWNRWVQEGRDRRQGEG